MAVKVDIAMTFHGYRQSHINIKLSVWEMFCSCVWCAWITCLDKISSIGIVLGPALDVGIEIRQPHSV